MASDGALVEERACPKQAAGCCTEGQPGEFKQRCTGIPGCLFPCAGDGWDRWDHVGLAEQSGSGSRGGGRAGPALGGLSSATEVPLRKASARLFPRRMVTGRESHFWGAGMQCPQQLGRDRSVQAPSWRRRRREWWGAVKQGAISERQVVATP